MSTGQGFTVLSFEHDLLGSDLNQKCVYKTCVWCSSCIPKSVSLPSLFSKLKSGSCRLLCLFSAPPSLYLLLPHSLASFPLKLIRNKPFSLPFLSSSFFCFNSCVISYSLLVFVFVFIVIVHLPSICLTHPVSCSCFRVNPNPNPNPNS